MKFMNEEWIDQYAGEIPFYRYAAQFEISDEKGLLVRLKSDTCHVLLDFGFVYGINILDEGVQLNDFPNCNLNDDIIPHSKFSSILYLVRNGRYWHYIKHCMGEDLFNFLHLQQFNIVTQNYNVMIICHDEPVISIEYI